MDQQQKKIIWVMCVIFALMLGALIVVPAVIDPGTVVGEFQAPEFDPDAQAGVPTPEQERQFAWLQMGDDIRIGLCGVPVLSGNEAVIWFASDETNTAWLQARIYDAEGNELGRSGLIRPGEHITGVELTPVPNGTASVTIRILSYEPETYYSLGSASVQVMLINES